MNIFGILGWEAPWTGSKRKERKKKGRKRKKTGDGILRSRGIHGHEYIHKAKKLVGVLL